MELNNSAACESAKVLKVFITDDNNSPDACRLMEFEGEEDEEDEVQGSSREMIMIEVIFAISKTIRTGKKSVYICPKNTRVKRDLIDCLRVLKVDFAIDL